MGIRASEKREGKRGRRERARKKEKTLTERAAARQGLLRRARPAGRSEPRSDCSFSLPLARSPLARCFSFFFSRRRCYALSLRHAATGRRALPLASPSTPGHFPLPRATGGYQRKEGKKPLETSRLAQKTTAATTTTTITTTTTTTTTATVSPPPSPSKNRTPPAHVCQLRVETP